MTICALQATIQFFCFVFYDMDYSIVKHYIYNNYIYYEGNHY